MIYSKQPIFQIKKLVWEEVNSQKWVAKSPVGSFYIEISGREGNRFNWWSTSSETSTKRTCLTMDLAIHDAQREFEIIIQKGLSPALAIISKNGKNIDIVEPIEDLVNEESEEVS